MLCIQAARMWAWGSAEAPGSCPSLCPAVLLLQNLMSLMSPTQMSPMTKDLQSGWSRTR